MNSRGFSGFFGYFGALPKKPKKTLAERIRGLLAGGRSIVGRGDIQRELWPNGFTLEDTADLNRTLNRMIRDGEVVETKRDIPGAHQFAPAEEYVYTAGPDSVAAGKVRVLSEDGYTWLLYKNDQLIDEYPVD